MSKKHNKKTWVRAEEEYDERHTSHKKQKARESKRVKQFEAEEPLFEDQQR
jgi:hypothetical protein